MEAVYRISGISRQAYHQAFHQHHADEMLSKRLTEMVVEFRKEYPRSSARKIHRKLQISDIGINKFENLVARQSLNLRPMRTFIKTTYSKNYQYPNLVNGLVINGINQLWVSDITYFLTSLQTYYLVLIMDVYSRRIIGYSASDNLRAVNNENALKMAYKVRGMNKFPGLIHHSDKGSQYGAGTYLKLLSDAEVKISMAGNCLENPYAERINGIIKNDHLIAFEINTLKQLQKALSISVKRYNEYPHGQHKNMMNPIEFENYLSLRQAVTGEKMKLFDFTENTKN
jgi:putative transposase